MAVTLNIGGMTCGHCVYVVTKALQAVAGVENVLVNLGTRQAHVEGSAELGALIRAVEEEGYEAQTVASQ